MTVLNSTAGGGQQQRLLVYKTGKRGKSLQRTAVKAAARGNLTWRNPACVGEAAAGAAAGTRPASGQAAGVAPAAGAASGPSRSKGSHAPALSLPRRRSSKWHKYIRPAAEVPAAAPGAPKQVTATPASKLASDTRRKQRGLGSAAAAVGRGGSKLLRLGGTLYKVWPRRCGHELQLMAAVGATGCGWQQCPSCTAPMQPP